MRKATKVFTALAACALVWAGAPVLATCPNSSPIIQNGALGGNPGQLLSGAPIGGFFWELNQGDEAAVGDQSASNTTGVDCGILCAAPPVVADPVWISRAGGPAVVQWDWGNTGTDGCLTGGTGAGVNVFYLIDGGGDYAIVTVNGKSSPVPHHDLGAVVNGLGVLGNDVQFRSTFPPVLANVSVVDSATIQADVLPANSSNIHWDAGGPYPDVVDGSGLTGPCPDGSGCNGVNLPREQNVCWTGNAQPAGATTVQGICMATMGPCVNDPSDPCLMFASVCNESTVVLPFGPPIPGGCVFIGGPTIDDTALLRRSVKNRQYRDFSFDVTQFAVSHMNILATDKGDRVINSNPIARIGANDGSTVTYTYSARANDLRGAKKFALQVVRTDGQTFTVNEE